MVRLAADAHYRVSKRGLVLAGSTGETVLFEHPRAAELPDLLATDPDQPDLESRLGPPLDDGVIADLVDLHILTTTPIDAQESAPCTRKPRRINLTRSGVMIPGIATPARWLNAHLVPAIANPVGITAVCVVVLGGAIALSAGRPDLPPVSDAPAVEAVLMIVIGVLAVVCHELAHAVALVHYGRTPRGAGFGFYWGSISFFVDSSPAMTLPRRARVIQSLAGLGVDTVTTAGFAIAAHSIPNTMLGIVFWRLAILGLVDIGINLAPILQVDGHWALADLLDEPDLSPRARRALGAAARGHLPTGQRGLAAYGAVSLLGGLALLGVYATVFWSTTRELITHLLAGNGAEVALGIYYVAPIAIGILTSGLGLVLEPVMGLIAAAPDATQAPG